MKCPFCENLNTNVIDSRDAAQAKIVRRRRICESCQARFTTYERPVLTEISVQKRNGLKEPYQRKKIERGLFKALKKRPVNHEKIRQLIDQIEGKIFAKNQEIITSKEIGQYITQALKDVDQVAYLRFLSVYQSFGSIESFYKEIKKLKKDKPT
ncbi:MAG: transcriptional repressor NrdR [Candidatus Moranbacteria bacterium]|nr:transcriptional repressor NrdR [Candidatus Moranbacteria bacterium]